MARKEEMPADWKQVKISNFSNFKDPIVGPKSYRGRKRKSVPSERVYRKRYEWWRDHGYGDKAAKWAASYRLGEPKRARGLSPEDTLANINLDRAISIAKKRKATVEFRMSKFPKRSREDIISDMDKELLLKNRAQLILRGRTFTRGGKPLDASMLDLEDKLIEANIFKDDSP